MAAFSDYDSAALYRVFLALKLLADLSAELPQWNPKELPGWLTRLLKRIGGGSGEFAEAWNRLSAEEDAAKEEAERTVEPDRIARS